MRKCTCRNKIRFVYTLHFSSSAYVSAGGMSYAFASDGRENKCWNDEHTHTHNNYTVIWLVFISSKEYFMFSYLSVAMVRNTYSTHRTNNTDRRKNENMHGTTTPCLLIRFECVRCVHLDNFKCLAQITSFACDVMVNGVLCARCNVGGWRWRHNFETCGKYLDKVSKEFREQQKHFLVKLLLSMPLLLWSSFSSASFL